MKRNFSTVVPENPALSKKKRMLIKKKEHTEINLILDRLLPKVLVEIVSEYAAYFLNPSEIKKKYEFKMLNTEKVFDKIFPYSY